MRSFKRNGTSVSADFLARFISSDSVQKERIHVPIIFPYFTKYSTEYCLNLYLISKLIRWTCHYIVCVDTKIIRAILFLQTQLESGLLNVTLQCNILGSFSHDLHIHILRMFTIFNIKFNIKTNDLAHPLNRLMQKHTKTGDWMFRLYKLHNVGTITRCN